MQINDFNDWVSTAAPNDQIVYHCGFLARDRHDEVNNQTKVRTRLAVPGLDELATAVLVAATAGQVVLLQKRLARERYEYRCTKTGRAGPLLAVATFAQPATNPGISP